MRVELKTRKGRRRGTVVKTNDKTVLVKLDIDNKIIKLKKQRIVQV